MFYMWSSVSFEEANQFANPEYYGCATDDDCPVNGFERFDIEELSSECDDENLTYKNNQCDEAKASASFEMEC